MSDSLNNSKIGILGLGKMGGAIASGLSSIKTAGLFGFDPIVSSLPGVSSVASAAELESTADIILLCVKPQDMKQTLSALKGNKKYISIAAGIRVEQLESYLHGAKSIARVMPSLTASINQSVTGIYSTDASLLELTRQIFESIGHVEVLLKEELMNAVTGLSGSGPAYVFEFIDALAQGGVASGLSYDAALKLAAKTVAASAELLLKEKRHPSELRSAVTSPGGTTIAGLRALEDGAFKSTVMKAVEEATKRSRELSS